MAFLLGVVARSSTNLVKNTPSSPEAPIQEIASKAAGKAIRAGVLHLRLESLTQKSPLPDASGLPYQEYFGELVAIIQTTFEQEFAKVEELSDEAIVSTVTLAAEKLFLELRKPKNLAKVMSLYLKELEEAVNVPQELVQEFITEFHREAKKRKVKPSWPRQRAVLGYYLGRWTIPIGLGFFIFAAFVHAYSYEARGNYDTAFGYLAAMFTCLVMLRLWFWFEGDLIPQPPKDSNLSRKAFLTQPGGYFENPRRFLVWCTVTLLVMALMLLATVLTIQTLGGSNEIQPAVPVLIINLKFAVS
ncbi:MAG: hypothetical protein ACFFGZ_14975 [Candidatus Thorarchaeota archaeon]